MKYAKIVTVFVLCLLAVSFVSAMGIGISPPRVSGDNLFRGSHFEKTILLSRPETETQGDYHVIVEVKGPLKDWINTTQGNFLVLPDGESKLPITVTIDVPQDAANGGYNADMVIKFAPIENGNLGVVGSSTSAGVTVEISFSVTGEQITDFKIDHVIVPDTEESYPLDVILNVINNGNVKATPKKVDLRVFGPFKKALHLEKEFVNLPFIEPFSTDNIFIQTPHTLSPGNYWAIVNVYNDTALIRGDELPFEVLEDGALARDGVLKEITTKEQVEEGEVVKISGLFENTGQGTLSAQLIAEVYFGEAVLVEVVEGEEISVPESTTRELEAYFTPTKSGRHSVSGHVLYSGARTDSKTTTFMVGEGVSSNYLFVIVLVIVFALLLIFWFVRRRRKRDEDDDEPEGDSEESFEE